MKAYPTVTAFRSGLARQGAINAILLEYLGVPAVEVDAVVREAYRFELNLRRNLAAVDQPAEVAS